MTTNITELIAGTEVKWVRGGQFDYPPAQVQCAYEDLRGIVLETHATENVAAVYLNRIHAAWLIEVPELFPLQAQNEYKASRQDREFQRHQSLPTSTLVQGYSFQLLAGLYNLLRQECAYGLGSATGAKFAEQATTMLISLYRLQCFMQGLPLFEREWPFHLSEQAALWKALVTGMIVPFPETAPRDREYHLVQVFLCLQSMQRDDLARFLRELPLSKPFSLEAYLNERCC